MLVQQNATIELDSDDYVELYAKDYVELYGPRIKSRWKTANNRCF